MIYVYLQLLSSLIASIHAHQASRLFDERLWSEIDQSPLKVELRSLEFPSNNVQAIFTNGGAEATHWPLSTEQLTSYLQIYTANDEPAARTSSAHAHETHNTTYQLLQPGASVIIELEVHTVYDLDAGEEYYFQMGGFMPYYHANQDPSVVSSQSQSHIFEAQILHFTAPTNSPRKRHANPQTTQNSLLESCADGEMDAKLRRAVPQALLQAKKSIEYVKNGKDRTTMLNFFKSDTPETRKVVINRFNAIVKFLSSGSAGNGASKLACSSARGAGATNHRLCVAAGAVAMTDPTSGKVSLCPAAKRYPVEFRSCGDSNWGGTLIHELTHSKLVFTPVTTDITYELRGCKGLSREKALLNANNFNFLADSVMLGRSC